MNITAYRPKKKEFQIFIFLNCYYWKRLTLSSDEPERSIYYNLWNLRMNQRLLTVCMKTNISDFAENFTEWVNFYQFFDTVSIIYIKYFVIIALHNFIESFDL